VETKGFIRSTNEQVFTIGYLTNHSRGIHQCQTHLNQLVYSKNICQEIKSLKTGKSSAIPTDHRSFHTEGLRSIR